MANVNFTSSTLGNGLVTPAQSKVTLESAYLDIRNSGWAQQYLPDLYESEIERYGDRSISGFLGMVGAEMPMSSDQVIWSEQGRLHLAYKALINPTTEDFDGPNSLDVAFFIFNLFLANSITAICIPKQIPKNGIPFLLA